MHPEGYPDVDISVKELIAMADYENLVILLEWTEDSKGFQIWYVFAGVIATFVLIGLIIFSIICRRALSKN